MPKREREKVDWPALNATDRKWVHERLVALAEVLCRLDRLLLRLEPLTVGSLLVQVELTMAELKGAADWLEISNPPTADDSQADSERRALTTAD
jgi:hypothetical protein